MTGRVRAWYSGIPSKLSHHQTERLAARFSCDVTTVRGAIAGAPENLYVARLLALFLIGLAALSQSVWASAWLEDWVSRAFGIGHGPTPLVGDWWLLHFVFGPGAVMLLLLLVGPRWLYRGLVADIRRSGRLPVCRKCGYPLDREATDAVRCPECGTLNDARKWVVDREWAGE